MPSSAKFRLYTIVALVILIWSTGYTLMGYTMMKGFPPAWLPAARTTLPALAITLYIYMSGNRLPPLKDMRWFWYGLMGFLGMTAPFYLQAKGQMVVESGLASILINGSMPLFTIILVHFFVKSERLNLRKTLGFGVGAIGVFLLFLSETLSWKLHFNWQAQTLVLMVALSYALASIVAKRAPDTPASVGAAIMLIAATIVALVMAASSGLPTENMPGGLIIALFVLSIFYTGLSDILYLKIIKSSGPMMIAKINYIVPVFALIFGMIFLGEGFSWRSVAAMMIIITGLLIARSDED